MGSESGRRKDAERRDAVFKRDARLRAEPGRTSQCYRRRGRQRVGGSRECALCKRAIIRVGREWGGDSPDPGAYHSMCVPEPIRHCISMRSRLESGVPKEAVFGRQVCRDDVRVVREVARANQAGKGSA